MNEDNSDIVFYVSIIPNLEVVYLKPPSIKSGIIYILYIIVYYIIIHYNVIIHNIQYFNM